MKTFFCIPFLLFIGVASFAKQSDAPFSDNQATIIPIDICLIYSNDSNTEIRDTTNNRTYSIIDSTFQIKPSIAYPPTSKDFRKLGIHTAMYLGVIVISFGILWTMPESTTGWDKQSMKENGITYKWKENVAAGPVWDDDNWTMNYLAHPYVGGVYYITIRGCGFSVMESFAYSALMSTFFWEYGVEACAQIPSIQDLIITPVVGSAIGEGFFYAKKSILKHDRKVLNSRFLGETTLLIIDPFNTVLDGMGYKQKVKTQMNIAPVGVNQFSKNAVWGVNFSATF
ncbi:MAG: DUF3943 domain-containing protein [Flavobacterium sp.]|nr:DUF3943 domain-containing protein [Flavobacterium sp.]